MENGDSVAHVTVDPHEVGALATSLGVYAQNIGLELDELDARVAHLRDQWTGEAKVAYDDAKTAWTEQMVELTQFLSSIATAVGGASEAYAGYETALVQRI
jgi:WXG100 family type VII secretion target